MSEVLVNALWSITPTVSLALLFWFIIRSMLRQDKQERDTYQRVLSEERAKLAANGDPVQSSGRRTVEG